MFLPICTYLVLFAAFFFLPGLWLTVLLGIKQFRFLLACALSYALLVLTLLPFVCYALPVAHWALLIRSLWLGLAAAAIIKTFLLKSRNHAGVWRKISFRRVVVPLGLIALIAGYTVYAGAYLEIPSDAWHHVQRMQDQCVRIVAKGVFPGAASLWLLFLKQGWHWYFLNAWLCSLAGLPVMQALGAITCANTVFFLLAIYYFGLFVFARLRFGVFKKTILAGLAALLTAATLGFMVFAYIRYYALAPAMFNHILVLAAVAVSICWLHSERWLDHALWIVPGLTIVANTIHTQEALFILVMLLAVGIWKSLLVIRCLTPKHGVLAQRLAAQDWKALALTGGLIIAFAAGFVAVRHRVPGAWLAPDMITPHIGIPPEPVNFILRSFWIAPPKNPYWRLAVHQLFVFYQVVGLWGIFVYALFGLTLRHYWRNTYLMAGLLIAPLLTVFNPLAMDVMVRLRQEVTLYRFSYLLPLPFVAGLLLAHYGCWPWLRGSKANWRQRLGGLLVLGGLLGLLFPLNCGIFYAPYSKFYTLRKTAPGNDYRLWDDLGQFMTTCTNKLVFTDPRTIKVLPCYSPANRYTTSNWLTAPDPEATTPERCRWEQLRGLGIFVINGRDGAASVTGAIARHWPEDALKVSRHYSAETRAYLAAQTDRFEVIWSCAGIVVYAVKP